MSFTNSLPRHNQTTLPAHFLYNIFFASLLDLNSRGAPNFTKLPTGELPCNPTQHLAPLQPFILLHIDLDICMANLYSLHHNLQLDARGETYGPHHIRMSPNVLKELGVCCRVAHDEIVVAEGRGGLVEVVWV